jgi:hypothetical protein
MIVKAGTTEIGTSATYLTPDKFLDGSLIAEGGVFMQKSVSEAYLVGYKNVIFKYNDCLSIWYIRIKRISDGAVVEVVWFYDEGGYNLTTTVNGTNYGVDSSAINGKVYKGGTVNITGISITLSGGVFLDISGDTNKSNLTYDIGSSNG